MITEEKTIIVKKDKLIEKIILSYKRNEIKDVFGVDIDKLLKKTSDRQIVREECWEDLTKN